MCQKFIVCFGPILEYASGDLALGDGDTFENEGVISVFMSPEEAISAWVSAMTTRNIDLVELPKRQGFGIVFSATPCDGAEGVLYNVEIYRCGFGSTE